MTGSVFVATRRNSRDIQSVMDKAFAQDPTVQWVSDDPEVFAREHHRYVQMCAEPAFDHNGVHATADFEGAAIWYPPGISLSDEAFAAFTQSVSFPDRLNALGTLAEACDRHRPSGPHWTLELIAVDPAFQNKGIGARLMEFGLAICDRSGLPVFLASSNSANLPFYRRLGFSLVTDMRMPGLPVMYPMIREGRA